MRFRFCGDLDCPDWILAEISTLSRITSVKMKLLCSQVSNDLLGSGIDYEKIVKLTTDAKYDASDVKAAVAALAFILTSATKYGVDEESLSSELQQLGLPKEHTSALCKVYAEKFVSLQDNFRQQSLKFTSLDEIHWRVDYLLSSSELKQINQPVVQLCLGVREQQSKSYAFSMTAEKFRVLLYELKQAYHMMETVG